MAPALLGYHRQVKCSACQYEFAHSATAGKRTTRIASAQSEILGDLADATCPNCGQASFDTSRFPRNEGDQLLVHKHAYAFRSPRRWETIVFRNPSNPIEAYVKRVGGLPGESIDIVRGDVLANNVLQRKSLLTQRSMRVLVHDDGFRPDRTDSVSQSADIRWQPRWRIDGEVLEQDGRYDFSADQLSSQQTDWRWVSYQHWLRSGGTHRSQVDLSEWPTDATMVAPAWREVTYEQERGKLIAHGVLSDSWYKRLKNCSKDPQFLAAVDLLKQKSHQCPVVDHYGYNREGRHDANYAVRDLMWSAQVRAVSGQFRIQMLYGRQPFYATFDLSARQVSISTLGPAGREDLLAVGPLGDELSSDTGALVEMSLFDRQVLVAIGDTLALPAVPFTTTELADRRSRKPVRFGVRGLTNGTVTSVATVKLYRDVYVTPKGDDKGTFVVADGEYFVLGDNSPVSVDSRVWDHPSVAHHSLIGKPFLVHLPSRQQQIRWQGETRHVRLPDWDRVRYVR